MLGFFNLAFPGNIRSLICKFTFSGQSTRCPLDSTQYATYLACLNCKTLYKASSGFTTNGDGSKSANTCSYRKFAGGEICGARLCNITCDHSGRLTCVSVHSSQRVSYFSLRDEIQRVLNLPLAKSNLHTYASETAPVGIFRNIWDGNVFRQFTTKTNPITGNAYLRGNIEYIDIALGLNLDAFQPYEGQIYSVTAIYLTILNLPSDVRNRSEYMILLAVLPGPDEPSVRMFSSYLQPLVSELTAFASKDGVPLTIAGYLRPVWAYLILISADWPVRW
jgi:hypothetical protein